MVGVHQSTDCPRVVSGVGLARPSHLGHQALPDYHVPTLVQRQQHRRSVHGQRLHIEVHQQHFKRIRSAWTLQPGTRIERDVRLGVAFFQQYVGSAGTDRHAILAAELAPVEQPFRWHVQGFGKDCQVA